MAVAVDSVGATSIRAQPFHQEEILVSAFCGHPHNLKVVTPVISRRLSGSQVILDLAANDAVPIWRLCLFGETCTGLGADGSD